MTAFLPWRLEGRGGFGFVVYRSWVGRLRATCSTGHWGLNHVLADSSSLVWALWVALLPLFVTVLSALVLWLGGCSTSWSHGWCLNHIHIGLVVSC